jgi:hypothetical protein
MVVLKRWIGHRDRSFELGKARDRKGRVMLDDEVEKILSDAGAPNPRQLASRILDVVLHEVTVWLAKTWTRPGDIELRRTNDEERSKWS